MKKLYFIVSLVFSTLSFAQTFYTENMGIPVGTTAISAHVFQNSSPIIYTGTADARATVTSFGYNGASGNGNIFINAIDEFFQIDGINSSAFAAGDLQLSFGVNTPTNVSNVLTVEVSTDATNWTSINYTPTAIGWSLATISGGVIPSSATLSIRFKSATTLQYRIDDVKLSSVSASCTLTLGTVTTVCDMYTLGTDTYTATIPYTGGGNAVYNIVTNTGIIGGDNPSLLSAGNIIISGIAEGASVNVNVIGGTCNLSAAINSPECKPINTLPYTEPFTYPVGSNLGNSQKWNNLNSGDAILVAAGNLNYANFPNVSGNSITFTGAGIDCFTPFTATSAGTVYASFMVNITDMANVTVDLTETYFAGLTDAAKGYKARMFFKKNGTQYQLGFDTLNVTTNYDATLRNTGEIVFIVMGYDFGTNVLSAWINPDLSTFNASTPASLTSTPALALTDLGGFIIRQDTDTKTPTMIMDELRVNTTVQGLLSVNAPVISGLKVYPNPVKNGRLVVETATNSMKAIAIYDVIGKQVLGTVTNENNIDVSTLQAGIYVIKITEAGKTATQKLVVE
ncbi:MAG: T9SS type A sorting domain-containing protein [Flavobacterium sp.]|nr:T9SS type A sorting domain-containing protein [Flavobacterium sp.]